MANLFGLPTPAQVRADANKRLFGTLNQYGGGALGNANMGGAAMGMALGRMFGGESADEKRAGKVQAIQTQFSELQNARGIKPPQTLEEYSAWGQGLAGELMKAGETDYAMEVMKGLSSMQSKSSSGQRRKPLETPEGFYDVDAGEYLKNDKGERLMPLNSPEVSRQRTEETGRASNRIKLENKAFETIEQIRTNNADLLEAKRLVVEEGANTGRIVSRLPSWKSSSIALDNMQKKLGLNVIGGVTFGALSKGELDLALSVAIPKDLSEKDLVKWIDRKIAAQNKLSDYYGEQISYFKTKGATKAGWLKRLKDKQENDPLGLL